MASASAGLRACFDSARSGARIASKRTCNTTSGTIFSGRCPTFCAMSRDGGTPYQSARSTVAVELFGHNANCFSSPPEQPSSKTVCSPCVSLRGHSGDLHSRDVGSCLWQPGRAQTRDSSKQAACHGTRRSTPTKALSERAREVHRALQACAPAPRCLLSTELRPTCQRRASRQVLLRQIARWGGRIKRRGGVW